MLPAGRAPTGNPAADLPVEEVAREVPSVGVGVREAPALDGSRGVIADVQVNRPSAGTQHRERVPEIEHRLRDQPSRLPRGSDLEREALRLARDRTGHLARVGRLLRHRRRREQSDEAHREHRHGCHARTDRRWQGDPSNEPEDVVTIQVEMAALNAATLIKRLSLPAWLCRWSLWPSWLDLGQIVVKKRLCIHFSSSMCLTETPIR